MKRLTIFIFISLILISVTASFAQTTAKLLDTLVIDIWPDYDRASVLFLLTGSLPANTILPATVTLPFPETAQLNAIARIDSSDGKMKDDILSSPAPGEISFITPNLRFRLEYYLPYAVNDLQRTFDFAWLAEIAVENFQLNIQQPLSASSLATEPAAADVVTRGDEFIFHTFPTRVVLAGQPYLVHVNYKMTTSQLSVESRRLQKTDEQTPGLSAGSSAGSGINWTTVAIVIGGLIIFVVSAWQMISRRPSSKTRKSHDTRVVKQSRTILCQNCGKPEDENHKFCGECGSEL